MIWILKYTKGHNAVKCRQSYGTSSVSNCLLMLYILTKFCEGISKVSKVRT